MGGKQYDIAISHAYGDKDNFATELALELKSEGARVWCSGLDLATGDSISESVSRALSSSDYSVVIISPVYLGYSFAMTELRALLMNDSHERVIAVVHNLGPRFLVRRWPALEHKLSISSKKGTYHVLDCIISVIKDAEGRRNIQKRKNGYLKRRRAAGRSRKDMEPGMIVLGGNAGAANMIGTEEQEKKKKRS